MNIPRLLCIIFLVAMALRSLPGMTPYVSGKKPEYDYEKPGIYVALIQGLAVFSLIGWTLA